MANETDDPYESTTRWLQEAAGRQSAPQQETAPAVKKHLEKRRRERTFLGVGREIYMFAVLVALYLNYYFMQVIVEIDSLPSIVVFIPQ